MDKKRKESKSKASRKENQLNSKVSRRSLIKGAAGGVLAGLGTGALKPALAFSQGVENDQVCTKATFVEDEDTGVFAAVSSTTIEDPETGDVTTLVNLDSASDRDGNVWIDASGGLLSRLPTLSIQIDEVRSFELTSEGASIVASEGENVQLLEQVTLSTESDIQPLVNFIRASIPQSVRGFLDNFINGLINLLERLVETVGGIIEFLQAVLEVLQDLIACFNRFIQDRITCNRNRSTTIARCRRRFRGFFRCPARWACLARAEITHKVCHVQALLRVGRCVRDALT